MSEADEARIFRAAEAYRDEVSRILRTASGSDRLVLVSSNVLNLLRGDETP